MRDLILAVDQGTQSVRAMIFDLHGQLVAKSQIHIQPYYSRQVQLAKESGLTREGLYKALSAEGNPSLGTALKVLKALGLKLTPQVA